MPAYCCKTRPDFAKIHVLNGAQSRAVLSFRPMDCDGPARIGTLPLERRSIEQD